jgi:type I restriction enzyme, S subunit
MSNTTPPTGLPSAWEETSIGEVAGVTGGVTKNAARVSGHSYPYLRVANVYANSLRLNEIEEITVSAAELQRVMLRKGDLLIVEGNGSLDQIGRVAMWDGSIAPCVHQNHLIKVRCLDSSLPQWVLYWLLSPEGRELICRQASSTSGLHTLSLSKVSGLPVRIAPAGVRRSTVEALDSYLTRLDAATEGLKRVEANLKRYRASVLKAAVEGHLVPTEAELAQKEKREFEPASVLLERILKERRHCWEQSELAKMKAKGEVPKNDKWKDKYEEPSAPDTSDLPELPEGWCWVSLDQLSLSVRNGISTPPNETEGAPILRISAVRALSLNLEDIRYLPNSPTAYQGFELETGDLLFTRYNGNPALVGACARVSEGTGGIYYPDKLIRVRPVSGTLVSSEFTELAAAAGASREHLNRWTKTTAGQAGISGADIKKMPVPLPPLLEQERVANAVSDAWSVASNASHSVAANLAHLTRLRQSILRWAFEGKLVDQDPNDEPASALLERIRRERESSQPVKTPKPERARRKTA